MYTPEKNWTQKQAIQALQKCAAEKKVTRLYVAVYRYWAHTRDVPDLPAIHRLFPGGWSRACQAADLDTVQGYPPKFTLQQAETALAHARAEWGDRPMGVLDLMRLLKGMSESEQISRATINYYWGTWARGAAANGIAPIHVARVERDPHWPELVSNLDLVPASTGKFDQVRPKGQVPASRLLARAWKGWDRFQLAAGCTMEEIEAARA